MPWDETEDYVRSGHKDIGKYDKDSIKTIVISEEKGIKAVVGCPKSNFVGGKCKVGMEIQSYLFSKDEQWTIERAKKWFKAHKKAKAAIKLKALSAAQIKSTITALLEKEKKLNEAISKTWEDAPKELKDKRTALQGRLTVLESEKRSLEHALGEIIIDKTNLEEPVNSMAELGKVMKGPVERLGFKVLNLRAKALSKSKRVGGVGSSRAKDAPSKRKGE